MYLAMFPATLPTTLISRPTWVIMHMIAVWIHAFPWYIYVIL